MPELNVMLKQMMADRLVTIPQAETPLIKSTGSACADTDALTVAVNFLRCGCRSVQILVEFSTQYTQEKKKRLISK